MIGMFFFNKPITNIYVKFYNIMKCKILEKISNDETKLMNHEF